MMHRDSFAIILLALTGPLAACAATLLVPAQYPTIQAAIAAAAGNDTILVGPGRYAERIDLSNRPLKLRAAQGPAFTTIDGQGAGTVVTWNNASGQSVLEGFTITNGHGANGTDGIAQSGGQSGGNGVAGGLRASGQLKVRDCIFLANRGGDGGRGIDAVCGIAPCISAGFGGTGGPGAVQIGTNVTLALCTFSENIGGNGGAAGKGAIGVSQAGTPGAGGPGCIAVDGPFTVLYLCRFRANTGGVGGRGANANPLASSATQPTAGGAGGAGVIAYYAGTVTVTNCLFDFNRGGLGGSGGDGVTLPGGTFVTGATGGAGGPGVGISATQPLILSQITTYSNVGEVGGAGGALQGAEGTRGPGVVRGTAVTSVQNSILAMDFGTLFVPGVTASFSAFPGATAGGGNVNLQGSPFAHGYQINAVAALIDSASGLDAPRDGADIDQDLDTFELIPVDLSGRPRIVDAAGFPNTGIGPPPPIDMGAFEFNGLLNYPPGDANCDGVVNNFDIDPFVLALTQPIVYEHVYRNCWTDSCDTDGDGVLTNFDIDPFVALLVQ